MINNFDVILFQVLKIKCLHFNISIRKLHFLLPVLYVTKPNFRVYFSTIADKMQIFKKSLTGTTKSERKTLRKKLSSLIVHGVFSHFRFTFFLFALPI